MLIVATDVDDPMIFSNVRARNYNLKRQLSSCFHMKDLGLQNEQNKGSILLDYEAYIETVLKRFNISDCKLIKIPMSEDERLMGNMSPKDEQETARRKMFRIRRLSDVLCIWHTARNLSIFVELRGSG